MNEKPLERLHYYNGQRLQAADFATEQDYHIRVRRWLNRSLYTHGVAGGLQVVKVPKAPRVRISPGLALDEMGREIILLDEHEETVPGAHDDANKPIGLYLTIRYREDVTGRRDSSCRPAHGCGETLAWGGPSRVVAEPVFEWSRDIPHEDSGKVLLAFVGLGKGCSEVNLLDTSIRQNVGAASAAKVRQYALEGTRDVDLRNAAPINFHIRGRQPSSVTLYLRAELFPTYFYTETGRHTHTIHVDDVKVPAHKHEIPKIASEAGTPHKHTVTSVTADTDTDVWHGVLVAAAGFAATANPLTTFGIAAEVAAAELALWTAGALSGGTSKNLTLSPRPFTSNPADNVSVRVNMSVALANESAHTHDIKAHDTSNFPVNGTPAVINMSNAGRADATGVNSAGVAYEARDQQPALKFVNALQIAIDGADVTEAVLRQIRTNRPTNENWAALGNGLSTHALAARGLNMGSGPIRLDYLPGVTLGEGEHRVELTVLHEGDGGRVHFNLYVE